jgi:BA14K-like protein
MKRLPSPLNALPRRLARCCVLFAAMGGAALAQTTGAINPNPDPTESAAKPDVPPGGCMPIGLTASGEIVFPIQCKDFIDRERDKAAVEQKPPAEAAKPAMADEKQAVEPKPVAADEKPAPRQVEAVAPPQDAGPEISKPVDKPAEAEAVPRRAAHERRPRISHSGDCSHYRTYDTASGTYRGFDGRHHRC